MFPSTIMGHIPQLSLYVQLGLHPHPRLHPHHLPPGGLSVGCCFYEGLGHWLGVGGSFRSTLGSLRPLSSLCPLGKYQNFFLFSCTRTTCKIFCEYFFNLFFFFFFNFFQTFFQSYSYMYIHVFPSFAWPPRAQPKGGGTVTAGNRLCHMSHLSWLCDGF